MIYFASFGQGWVTLRELALDRILALEQPIHRGILRLFVTGVELKQFGHGGGVPPARGGELAVGAQLKDQLSGLADTKLANALYGGLSATPLVIMPKVLFPLSRT